MTLILNGCYKDDIDDLNKKYDDLKKEQQRQARLLLPISRCSNALEKVDY
ncbi:hypothetical protein MASR1M31_07760 [Porphyromonadaceae bacterium]